MKNLLLFFILIFSFLGISQSKSKEISRKELLETSTTNDTTIECIYFGNGTIKTKEILRKANSTVEEEVSSFLIYIKYENIEKIITMDCC